MSTITLDDIHAHVTELFHLLEMTYEQLCELDYGREKDGTRNHALDRIASMTCIARDLAERTAADIQTNYTEIRKAPLMVPGVPAEILELGSEVLALYERFNRRRKELEGGI